MKVTSGIYKGRKLIDNKFEHIRPTADMVKQAMFNKLSEIVVGGKVLDLFCGTGALGIEAISRGASKVVFADKDKRSVELTKNNLKNLNISAKVFFADYQSAIKALKGEKFDLIILDPPYMAGLYENALKTIFECELLSDGGVIVCEHERNVKIDFSPFIVQDEKNYGIKTLTYLSY